MAVIVVPLLCVTSTGNEDNWSFFFSFSAGPDSTLCFTLLAASRSCWACVQWQRVQCSRASQQPWATVPPLSPATLDMTFCLWKPLPHLPLSSPPSRSHVYHISALRETCPESHADREEEGRMNEGRSKWSSVFVIDFHPILPVLQLSVNTPLPYHLPLHPVTVKTSQPPRSAFRCVPLTDSCFTFPLVLPQTKTHSLSASSMQDPSALPGGGPTYPPSFRTTTSTSCCWRRPGCALPVTRPRSPTWLRLVLGPLLPPLCWGVLSQSMPCYIIFGITGSRLGSRISDQDINVPNRCISRNGSTVIGQTGIAVYIRNSIADITHRRQDLESDLVESIWLELKPSTNAPNFFLFFFFFFFFFLMNGFTTLYTW